MDVKKLLSTILMADGVSGRESAVAKVVAKEMKPFCDKVRIHHTQSVVGFKKATRIQANRPAKKLMFAAHLDQIGLAISKIEVGGFLRFTAMGYDYKVLTSQPVKILSKQPLKGVVSGKSAVLTANSQWAHNPSLDELFIDTGLPEAEVRKRVQVGDLVKLDLAPLELKNKFYSSPVLDDRSCVVAMLLALERLQNAHHDWDLYFVATSGEETTGKGARTLAWDINPDCGVAMDVTFALQPQTGEPRSFPVGKGLTISLGPMFDKKYRNQLVEVANQEKISFFDEADMVGFGTDAASIRRTAGGIPVNLISLPIKNMHTPTEVMSLDDLNELGRLVASFSSSIDTESLSAVNHKQKEEGDVS